MAPAILLYLYFACVTAVAIWCSFHNSENSIAYVELSKTVLEKWKIERQDLIVIDVFPRTTPYVHSGLANSLRISEEELAGLLSWIPSKSTVVLCYRMRIAHFGAQIEQALSCAGINTVYFLRLCDSVLPVRSALSANCPPGSPASERTARNNDEMTWDARQGLGRLTVSF
jgi:hypothetical protein